MILLILLLIILLFILFNSGAGYKESVNYNIKYSGPIMDGAQEYVSVRGNKKAILFIHGFPGTPKMYYMARELAINSGYDVFIPRLPGFGCSEEEFIKTNFSVWLNFLKEYYTDRRKKYDQFFIAGNSMGGSLTLKLAELYGDSADLRPTGICSVAAPVYLNSLKRGDIKSPLLYFIRLISLFSSYIPAKKPRKDKSLDQDGDTEWVGYRGLFPKQIYSLMLGLKGVKKDLYKIDIPCYICHAKEDKTVPFGNSGYIKDHINSDNILYRVMSLKEWSHTNHSMFIYKSVVGPLWRDIDYFFQSL